MSRGSADARLRDQSVRDATSFEDASARHAWSISEHYNIAEDCLAHPATATALWVEAETGVFREVQYGELSERVARLASALIGMGLAPGDRVAVCVARGLDMATIVLGVLRAGGIVVPLPKTVGADGLRYRLDDASPPFLFSDGPMEEMPGLADLGGELVAVSTGAPGASGLVLADLLQGARPSGGAVTRAEDPALLMYTSGTTGSPKGALQPHRFVLGHGPLDYAFDFIREDDVYYSPADWSWAGGLLLGLLVPLAYRVPIVATSDRRFEAKEVVRMLVERRVTIGLFPPTVLRMLREYETGTPLDQLSLRCLVSGAEAVTPDILEWAEERLGASVNNAYGQTEANCLVGHSAALGKMAHETLGRPYPGRSIEILNDALEPVASDEIGQIAVHTSDPVCMLEYFGKPEATAEKIASGWLLTGDSAHRDSSGLFYFHGRQDDLIKSSGYRIGPAEIEAVLASDPRVVECAVVGLPDSMRGERVTAFIRLDAGEVPSDALSEALRLAVRSRVGAHAYPREFRYVDDLPRTTTGKIQRHLLRQSAASEINASS